MANQEIDGLIKESIRECLKLNPKFHKSDTLVLTTYNILKSLFIERKKYILLEAPTGSGKSVIGYLIHFCYVYINNKQEIDFENPNEQNWKITKPRNTYLLTSSKMLQEQLSNDITKFSLDEYLIMLKGVKNYECEKLTKETGIYHNYSERFCMGMSMEAKEQLDCFQTCKYIQIRNEASLKDCTILNYSYFLNVLKNPMNPFFGTRDLTIADEAHLIPDIVLGMYNIEMTQYTLNKFLKLTNQIEINFRNSLQNEIFDLKILFGNAFQIFYKANPTLEDVKNYFHLIKDIVKSLNTIKSTFNDNKVFQSMFEKDFKSLGEDVKFLDNDDYIESLEIRPEDTFIKTELVGHFAIEKLGNNPEGSKSIYKHTVYDLSEAALCKKYFLTKVDSCIFMSATLGNIEEFAQLMGMDKSEYSGFRLSSNFNFNNSPILLTKSGYLDYKNFNSNIDKVLYDAIYVSENLHPNEKGIIHTSTFVIANKLKDKINSGLVPNKRRYLFYSTSEEKEACIEMMKSESNIGYIIVGPSLYEGLDLKDNQGRFNIIVKIPYSGIDDYTKKKMQRFPFWYLRQTLEKLIQAIGRTNRHIDDYSKIYILDSGADRVVYNMSEFMVERLKSFKIN